MEKEINVLGLMDTILEKMKSNECYDECIIEMKSENFNSAQKEFNILEHHLNISKFQILVLIALVEKDTSSSVNLSEIAHYMGISRIRLFSHITEVQDLKSKGFIFITGNEELILTEEALESLKRNEKPEAEENLSALDTSQVLAKINKKLNQLSRSQIPRTEALYYIEQIMCKNPTLSISKAYKKYVIENNLDKRERLIYNIALIEYYFEDDDNLWFNRLQQYFPDFEYSDLRCLFHHRSLGLQTYNIIEFGGTESFFSKEEFRIKDNIKDEIFADIGGIVKQERDIDASLRIKAENTKKKEMFYNEADQKSLDQLMKLVDTERYNKIKERLHSRGLRTGFTCLFYGLPGTGKTETVYQLARESGRDLFLIDISQIKSKWVGDSEKNINKVFQMYKSNVKDSKKAPILFFNEADAIFGTRMENAVREVDKMENSIQNIILQRMEDFDGILIATTNLETSLDPAFERRFLYKIHFHKPDVGTKTKIWKSMLPQLTENQAIYLSRRYDFSGGQIENVCRKREIDFILNEKEPDFEQICDYCANEQLGESPDKNSIGF